MIKPNHNFIAAIMAGASIALAGSATGQEADWSGFYLGGNFGVHDIQTSGLFDAGELGGEAPDLEGIGEEGVHLGIEGGYNFQLGQLVLGLEGGLSFGNFNGSIITVQDGSPDEAGLLNYPVEGELSYIGTIRGRVGFELEKLGSALVFVTGGVAFTDFEMDIADGRSDVGFKDSGLAWGGGIEIPISPRMALRADYLHIEFNERLNIAGVATSGVFDANDGNTVKLHDVDIMRFGIDLKIGGTRGWD